MFPSNNIKVCWRMGGRFVSLLPLPSLAPLSSPSLSLSLSLSHTPHSLFVHVCLLSIYVFYSILKQVLQTFFHFYPLVPIVFVSLHHSNLLSVCCLFSSFGFNPPRSLFPLFLCVILTHSHTLSLTHASTRTHAPMHTRTRTRTHAHTHTQLASLHLPILQKLFRDS